MNRGRPRDLAPGKRTLIESMPREAAPGKQTQVEALGSLPVGSARLARGESSVGTTTLTEMLRRAGQEPGSTPTGPAPKRVEHATGVSTAHARVHVGPTSQQAATALGARAFTIGRDIHFAAEQYRPDTPDGDQLIAHEVVHTLQRSGADDAALAESAQVSTPGDAAEQEADRIAHAAMAPAGEATSQPQAPQARVAPTAVLRAVATIAGESVQISDNRAEAERDTEEATEIIQQIFEKYEVYVSSEGSLAALRNATPEAFTDSKEDPHESVWTLAELRALRDGFSYFAPILGRQRTRSSRRHKQQEIRFFGRINKAAPAWHEDADAGGQYFERGRAAVLYDTALANPDELAKLEGQRTKERDSWRIKALAQQRQLTGIVIHELTHALMRDNLLVFAEELGWLRGGTPHKGPMELREPPITEYAGTKVKEDLSESVKFYFLEPERFAKQCPVRTRLIRGFIKGWSASEDELQKEEREKEEAETTNCAGEKAWDDWKEDGNAVNLPKIQQLLGITSRREVPSSWEDDLSSDEEPEQPKKPEQPVTTSATNADPAGEDDLSSDEEPEQRDAATTS